MLGLIKPAILFGGACRRRGYRGDGGGRLLSAVLLHLTGLLSKPSRLVPSGKIQIRRSNIGERIKERAGHLLVGVKLLSEPPVGFAALIAAGEPDEAKEQIRLEYIGPLAQNKRTNLSGLFLLSIAPERLGEANPRIEAVGMLLDHAAKLLDGLGEHVPLGVEPCQTGAAKAKGRPLGTPQVSVEAQQLTTEFGHIGAHFKRLLELGHGPVELRLTLKGDTQAHMGGDILGIGAQHAAERIVGMIELATRQVGFAKNAVGLKILREVLENMLRHTDCLLDLIGLEVAAGLVVCGLQAHRSHAHASCYPLQNGGERNIQGDLSVRRWRQSDPRRM